MAETEDKPLKIYFRLLRYVRPYKKFLGASMMATVFYSVFFRSIYLSHRSASEYAFQSGFAASHSCTIFGCCFREGAHRRGKFCESIHLWWNEIGRTTNNMRRYCCSVLLKGFFRLCTVVFYGLCRAGLYERYQERFI